MHLNGLDFWSARHLHERWEFHRFGLKIDGFIKLFFRPRRILRGTGLEAVGVLQYAPFNLAEVRKEEDSPYKDE